MIEREIHVSLEYHKKALDAFVNGGAVRFSDLYGWGENDIKIIISKLKNDNLINDDYKLGSGLIPKITILGYKVHFLLNNPIVLEFVNILSSKVTMTVENLLLIEQEIIKSNVHNPI